ncbi:MAG: acetyl-CoA C-acyltransferase [Thermotogae bacterium]|nr:acetyl-CoA C-acetyltransferase [Thermotogaceae bacterium]OQX57919.1 MAG: acetyl-CoA acetyltransferase [Thermotoga sp. 4484_232]RKX39820.1 MAG: acetyl-CoA C-acyltransferase [Thermotogota bacterium]RKX48839.1 MAG: acetyl-CoA C-acyltransferase [Thermotoga sp.]RKX48819.1 MAG: acetyl-CoA C-acyltransferase [Thermotogota bacterium]
MKDVFILGAKRTPIGTFGGSLKDIPAPKLAALVIKESLKQAKVSQEEVDEVIVGNILMAGQGMGPGRQASIYAGIPSEVPAYTVNMMCASGMKSIMIGSTDIALGEADLVVAAGMENMSQAPFLVPYKVRFGAKFGNMELLDHMIWDGLRDVFNGIHMGLTAEVLAEEFEITREEQDMFAYESQMKARKAIEEGRFKEEIVPVEVVEKKEKRIFSIDEHPRPNVTLEKLSNLKPVFKEGGTVTAGNASGINDGASSVILASEEFVEKKGLKPLARIVAWSQAAVDPLRMGLGPVPATEKILQKAKLSFQDLELIELNEAFAAQSLAVIKKWCEIFGVSKDWIMSRLNVNGGAIALGHPIGASGNRIVVTLIYEMKRRNLKIGLATLCVGGGMGTSLLIEML